jgi:hypothetical protein
MKGIFVKRERIFKGEDFEEKSSLKIHIILNKKIEQDKTIEFNRSMINTLNTSITIDEKFKNDVLENICLKIPLRKYYEKQISDWYQKPIRKSIKLSSFMLYKTFFFKELRDHYKEIRFNTREMTKIVAEAWSNETADIRNAFKALSAEIVSSKKEMLDKGEIEVIRYRPYKKKNLIKEYQKNQEEKEEKKKEEIYQSKDLKEIIEDQQIIIDKLKKDKEHLKRKYENNRSKEKDSNRYEDLLSRIIKIEKKFEDIEQKNNINNLDDSIIDQLLYNQVNPNIFSLGNDHMNNFQMIIENATSEMILENNNDMIENNIKND